eukprot:g31692.t1
MLQRVEQMLYGNSGLPIQAPKEPEPYWPGESMGDQWWKEEDPKSPTTPNSEAVLRRRKGEWRSPKLRTWSKVRRVQSCVCSIR